MATENDKQLYAKCMEYIKLRILAIDEIIFGIKTTSFPETNLDFVYLQFRFIFESIALASLCSHRKQYELFDTKFEKEWNANKIIKQIKKINPLFFPSPEDEKSKELALTEDELVRFIGLCGDNLHAFNPYKGKGYRHRDSQIEKERFLEWRTKVISLLGIHYVMLVGNKEVIRVVMRTIPNENVTVQNLEVIKIENQKTL